MEESKEFADENLDDLLARFACSETRKYISALWDAGFTFYMHEPQILREVIQAGKSAIPGLIQILRNPEEDFRIAALRMLWEITGKDFGSESCTDYPCVALTRGSWPRVIEKWEEWWIANRETELLDWLLEDLRNGKYGDRMGAIRKLGDLGDRRAIGALREALLDPLLAAESRQVYRALEKLGDRPYGAAYLIEITSSPRVTRSPC